MLLRASVEEHFAFLIPVQLAGTKHLQIIVLRMRDVHQTSIPPAWTALRVFGDTVILRS